MASDDRKTKVDHDNPPFSRLFVVCSKNHNEDDIKEAFGNYGKVFHNEVKVKQVWIQSGIITYQFYFTTVF